MFPGGLNGERNHLRCRRIIGIRILLFHLATCWSELPRINEMRTMCGRNGQIYNHEEFSLVYRQRTFVLCNNEGSKFLLFTNAVYCVL